MGNEWIFTTWFDLFMVAVSVIVTYAAVLAFTRIAGLRSFSKMTAPDFAMTLAVGSLFASTIATSKPPLFLGLFAIGGLFAAQWGIAFLRECSPGLRAVVDNEPLLLMSGTTIVDENMKMAQVTREDLYAKLREANVLQLSEVRAVVFETTGDISVLHAVDDGRELEPQILDGVAR